MFCCMLHAKHSQHALSPPARVVSVSHFRYMQKHMHGTHVRVVSAFAPCVTYMKSWTTNTSVTISLSIYTNRDRWACGKTWWKRLLQSFNLWNSFCIWETFNSQEINNEKLLNKEKTSSTCLTKYSRGTGVQWRFRLLK